MIKLPKKKSKNDESSDVEQTSANSGSLTAEEGGRPRRAAKDTALRERTWLAAEGKRPPSSNKSDAMSDAPTIRKQKKSNAKHGREEGNNAGQDDEEPLSPGPRKKKSKLSIVDGDGKRGGQDSNAADRRDEGQVLGKKTAVVLSGAEDVDLVEDEETLNDEGEVEGDANAMRVDANGGNASDEEEEFEEDGPPPSAEQLRKERVEVVGGGKKPPGSVSARASNTTQAGDATKADEDSWLVRRTTQFSLNSRPASRASSRHHRHSEDRDMGVPPHYDSDSDASYTNNRGNASDSDSFDVEGAPHRRRAPTTRSRAGEKSDSDDDPRTSTPRSQPRVGPPSKSVNREKGVTKEQDSRRKTNPQKDSTTTRAPDQTPSKKPLQTGRDKKYGGERTISEHPSRLVKPETPKVKKEAPTRQREMPVAHQGPPNPASLAAMDSRNTGWPAATHMVYPLGTTSLGLTDQPPILRECLQKATPIVLGLTLCEDTGPFPLLEEFKDTIKLALSQVTKELGPDGPMIADRFDKDRPYASKIAEHIKQRIAIFQNEVRVAAVAVVDSGLYSFTRVKGGKTKRAEFINKLTKGLWYIFPLRNPMDVKTYEADSPYFHEAIRTVLYRMFFKTDKMYGNTLRGNYTSSLPDDDEPEIPLSMLLLVCVSLHVALDNKALEVEQKPKVKFSADTGREIYLRHLKYAEDYKTGNPKEYHRNMVKLLRLAKSDVESSPEVTATAPEDADSGVPVLKFTGSSL